jgi:hypothetical protein
MTFPSGFLDGVRDPIANARDVLAQGVERIRVQTDLEIGRRIVEEEQRVQGPGTCAGVIEALADQLTGEFGQGFSAANLRRMRDFYLQNHDRARPLPSKLRGLKEPLVLEFLCLDEQTRYSESDLESAIITRIEHFLLELGKGFLFEARQKRFTFDEEHFFVDLVFYNRLLRCYVLIDLKIGKLTHHDLGQMQMYVNYFDRSVKTAQENSTIGIILCKQKNEALVEITLPKDANIHAREYQLYLPSKDELQQKLMEWIGENQRSDQ